MSEATFKLWFAAFLAVAILSLPYGLWMVLTAWRRQWRRLIWLTAIPVVGFVCLVVTGRFLDAADERAYYEGIFACPFSPGKPLFNHSPERDFNGDGLSLTVYPLSGELRMRFEESATAPLDGYPRLPSHRAGWAVSGWREGPMDKPLALEVEKVFNEAAETSPELKSQVESIRGSLGRKGTFHSAFVNRIDGHTYDIDLFVVDLERGLVWFINRNT